MIDVRDELVLFIHNAEFMCKVEHRCKNRNDCVGCEMFNRDCTKGYIADRLMEKFNISLKDGEDE